MWNTDLALPWWHQAMYQWQQEEVCIGLAYSTQHMASEVKYQSHKGGGVGSWRRQFQLQQREGLSHHRKLSTIVALPIPWSHFHLPPNPDARLPSMFGKIIRYNLVAPIADHKKNESARLMESVIGVTHTPYPSFGVIINIISKEDITYMLQLATSRIAHALTSQKCHPRLWKEREMGVLQTSLLCA